ncbi:MAG: hypothetical protein RLZ84_1536 [Actinomycetota bacterium]
MKIGLVPSHASSPIPMRKKTTSPPTISAPLDTGWLIGRWGEVGEGDDTGAEGLVKTHTNYPSLKTISKSGSVA